MGQNYHFTTSSFENTAPSKQKDQEGGIKTKDNLWVMYNL